MLREELVSSSDLLYSPHIETRLGVHRQLAFQFFSSGSDVPFNDGAGGRRRCSW